MAKPWWYKPPRTYEHGTGIGRHPLIPAGEKVPSVTEVLKIIDKSGPLMWWALGEMERHLLENQKDFVFESGMFAELSFPCALKDAKNAHRSTSDKALDIGSLVHEWCDLHAQGKTPNFEGAPPEAIRAYLKYLEWWSEEGGEIILTEASLYHPVIGYAGTVDRVWRRDRDSAVCMADWKSSKGIYPEHYLQLAAYAAAHDFLFPSRPVEDIMIVRVGKEDAAFDPDRDVAHIPREDRERHMAGFVAALNLWHWRQWTRERDNAR